MSLVCVLSPQGRVWWDFTQFLGNVWLAGGGIAVDLQFHIFSYLYTPDSANLDLAALGRSASALKLVTQSWTQVDTPSVASPISDHGR